VDLVRIDSIYNPVLRANFTVEETRVGQRTDFDRLTLLVETNGSMSPEEGVGYAAELARKHLEYMLRFMEPAEGAAPAPGAVRVPAPLRDLFARPIDELAELSVRSVNSLKKENIITLGDLVQRTEDQMLNIENFGIKSLEEIRQFLNEHNLHFGMKLEKGEDGDLYLIEGEQASGGECRGHEGRGVGDESSQEGPPLQPDGRASQDDDAEPGDVAVPAWPVETTTAKAKELRQFAEPLITRAKRGDLHARRLVARFITMTSRLGKLFGEIGPRYIERAGWLHAGPSSRPSRRRRRGYGDHRTRRLEGLWRTAGCTGCDALPREAGGRDGRGGRFAAGSRNPRERRGRRDAEVGLRAERVGAGGCARERGPPCAGGVRGYLH
jgi:hypothetical protein